MKKTMSLNSNQLVATSLSPLQTLQSSAPMQSLSSSSGNLASMSLEAAVLSSGPPGTIVSLPQTFCFPGNQLGNCHLSSGMTVTPNHSSSAATAQLSLGSMFSVSADGLTQQYMQPMNVQPQQTLTLPLNQQQQQTQQTLSVPHGLTLSQMPPGMSLVSQSLPLGQVVCSTVATPLTFMNPTIFTMSNGPGHQNQYISNSFTQFPIVLGNQSGIFAGLNTATALPPHGIENVSLSQVSRMGLSQAAPIELTNNLGTSHISSQTECISQIPSSSTALSSNSISVFSFASPAINVTSPIKSLEMNSQLSPDTTVTSQAVHVTQCNATQFSNLASTNLVSSSTPTPAQTLPAPNPSLMLFSELDNHMEPYKNEILKLSPVLELPVPQSNSCPARMKFTPVDSTSRAFSGYPSSFSKPVIEDINDMDHVEEVHRPVMNSLERSSPQSSFSLLDVKIEPYDPHADQPEDDYSKQSISPIEHLDLARKINRNRDISKTDVQGDMADVEDLEEAEFVWEDYLRETGTSAVPPTAFKHVETSLQSGFSKGMKLEAPNKHNPNTYWVATIVMTCGPLLRLRYEGYHDNSSADFWSDPMTSDIHPLGWCEENNKTLQPPEGIRDKHPNWQAFLAQSLVGAVRAPVYLLDKSTGATPVDQIKEGMRLEIQDEMRPNQLWLVKIMENVGGRLCLRYEGIDGASYDLWLFYLHERLHPIGWCKLQGYLYAPPSVVKLASGKTEQELMRILDLTLADATSQKLPADIFRDQFEIEPHEFRVGMKLEAVDDSHGCCIRPATVVEVIDVKYFVIEMDSLARSDPTRTRVCCHRKTPTIFPVNWAGARGIKLSTPHGWTEGDFRWSDYLTTCKASAAPAALFHSDVQDHEFECGMKLEAVKPKQPTQICAATITKIVEHLMWIHLDSSTRMMESHVESISSLNLFPIGWCVSVGYQLKPPSRIGAGETSGKRIAVVQPEIVDMARDKTMTHISSSGSALFGGPQIYFNHRCFSGPYLSKGRISELPRSVGPGPVTLVMKEVLSMLINTAYKSCRVLRELQLQGKPNPAMAQQMLKAKYKGKSYRAIVEICRTVGQLEEFCRSVCLKLECCSNLISPYLVTGNCPQNCAQLTKTKYTYYYGKRKKKIGRPLGGHSNLENGQKKPGKRKKKRKLDLLGKTSTDTSQAVVLSEPGKQVEDDKTSVCSDSKTVDSTSTSGSKDHTNEHHSRSSEGISSLNSYRRRYTHHIPPPSEIRTRGAKLPKYSFEKRTHKKIMIVEGSQQKEMGKSSHGTKDGQCVVESSFTCSRPEMPVTLKSEPPLKLEKNPLEWSVSEVGEFLKSTDCADRDLVARLKTEEIDGQALLLLTLPNVQEYMGIKLGPAIKLCHLIERIKIAFYETFAK